MSKNDKDTALRDANIRIEVLKKAQLESEVLIQTLFQDKA